MLRQEPSKSAIFVFYSYLVCSCFRITSLVNFSTIEIILMCSLLCSTDVIAAVSMLSPKKTPKLFSLVFGEGIVNDAVSIILFNTVNRFATQSK